MPAVLKGEVIYIRQIKVLTTARGFDLQHDNVFYSGRTQTTFQYNLSAQPYQIRSRVPQAPNSAAQQ
jgi:hypothetical protein